ncbi:hypothetical protein I552_7164 [Mycobacterium xenopi 3993]|nr:hypothetical protein I552_7164 [Mycobacterium xenopi 3993]
MGPPAGRLLATLLAENRQEALLQLLADRAFHWSLNAGEVIQRVVERDSPSWSPRFIDHLVGDRIHRELMDFTDKVRRNPNHELRRSATRFLFDFADDLQHDPATIARAEAVKEQLMARDEITNAAATAWKTLKRLVLEGVDDPSSALRTRITDTVIRIGESLRDDAELRDKVDNWIVRAAQHLVSQYGVEITAIITDTIERWDAEEASRRIELHVAATCSSSGSTARWWARWPDWRSTPLRSSYSEALLTVLAKVSTWSYGGCSSHRSTEGVHQCRRRTSLPQWCPPLRPTSAVLSGHSARRRRCRCDNWPKRPASAIRISPR